MSFDENVELISSYNEWVAQRKIMATDVTPEAFLKDQMKQEAADVLFRVVEYIETHGKYDDVTRTYDQISPGYEGRVLHTVHRMLKGEL